MTSRRAYAIRTLPSALSDDDGTQLGAAVSRFLLSMPSDVIAEFSIAYNGASQCELGVALTSGRGASADQAADALLQELGDFMDLVPEDRAEQPPSSWLRLLPARSSPFGVALWSERGLNIPDLLTFALHANAAALLQVWVSRVADPGPFVPVFGRRLDRLQQRNVSQPSVERMRGWDLSAGLFRVDVLVATRSQGDLERIRTAAGGNQVLEALALDVQSPESDPLTQLVEGRVVPADLATLMVPVVALPAESPAPVRRRPLRHARYVEPVGGRGIYLGRGSSGVPVELGADALAQHMVITGLSGFGKSTSMMSILWRLWKDHKIPFLVIDPEKTDYLRLMNALRAGGDRPAVLRLGGNSPLSINPLAVPGGVDPLAFQATFTELFDSVTGLSERVPLALAVLQSALRTTYSAWTLDGRSGWPSIAELYRGIAAYLGTASMSRETRAELRTSLLSRIESLLSGPGSTALAGGPRAGLDWGRLLERPAVVLLRDFVDTRSRELAFGLILAGLIAFRREHPIGSFGHLTVLEEAHMLFLGGEGPLTQPNPAAAAVASALATQRAAGEGIALVTQVPRQLPAVVLDLVSNRFSHRLPGSAAMSVAEGAGVPEAAEVLTALPTGEALFWTADRSSRGTQVLVDPVAEVVQSAVEVGDLLATDLAYDDLPDRIWCSRCPVPCTGRHWLSLVPPLVSRLIGRDGDINDLAEETALAAGNLARDTGLRAQPETLATAVYCVVSRTLTVRYADHPQKCDVAVDAAAAAAAGIDRRMRAQ